MLDSCKIVEKQSEAFYTFLWHFFQVLKQNFKYHKIYSNNIVNFQECTTILNACTKKSGNLLNSLYIIIHIYIYREREREGREWERERERERDEQK